MYTKRHHAQNLLKLLSKKDREYQLKMTWLKI